MRVLNLQRAEILLQDALCSDRLSTVLSPAAVAEQVSMARVATVCTTVCTTRRPTEYSYYVAVAQEEFVLPYKSRFQVDLLLEPIVRDLMATGFSSADFEEAVRGHGFVQPERYLLAVLHHSGLKRPAVALWFDDTAEPRDEFLGFVHACVLRTELADITLGCKIQQRSGQSSKAEVAAVPTLIFGSNLTSVHSYLMLATPKPVNEPVCDTANLERNSVVKLFFV